MLNLRLPHDILKAVLFAGALLLWAACDRGPRPDDATPVVVSVEPFPAGAVPGQALTLVWRLDIADGWHLYGPGRNDSGYPPRIDFELPTGWLVGGLQWPVPERYLSAGDILDHVYHGELVLLQRIGVGTEATPGQTVSIRAKVEWLACKEACVPGAAEVSLEIPVVEVADSQPAPVVARARAGLPQSLPADLLTVRWNGPTFHMEAAGAERLTFMPAVDCGLLADLIEDGQGPVLDLEFRTEEDAVGPVRGLLTIEPVGGQARTYRVDYPAVSLETANPGG